MEKNIQRRIQHYNAPNSVFLVMRDQDSAECHSVKQGLEEKVRGTGKSEKTLIRIACHELESFFLGDLKAVEEGLGIPGLSKKQNQQKFRTPDNLANAAEELKKVTGQKYRKLAGSRAISPHLALDDRNRSASFNMLISGDWLKIANTEMADASCAGIIGEVSANTPKNEPVILERQELYDIAVCDICRKFNGVKAMLVDGERETDIAPADSGVDVLIWYGKNNKGRKQSQWRLSIGTIHPNCRGSWKPTKDFLLRTLSSKSG